MNATQRIATVLTLVAGCSIASDAIAQRFFLPPIMPHRRMMHRHMMYRHVVPAPVVIVTPPARPAIVPYAHPEVVITTPSPRAFFHALHERHMARYEVNRPINNGSLSLEPQRLELVRASEAFQQDLTRFDNGTKWQAFLQLPEDVRVTGNALPAGASLMPNQAALAKTLDLFNRVARDTRFATLAQLPNFGRTKIALERYTRSLASLNARQSTADAPTELAPRFVPPQIEDPSQTPVGGAQRQEKMGHPNRLETGNKPQRAEELPSPPANSSPRAGEPTPADEPSEAPTSKPDEFGQRSVLQRR